MKKIIITIAAFLMSMTFGLAAQATVEGDVVANVLHSDILTTIDGYPIRTYNVNGYTYVQAEDLSNYGFLVIYDDVARALYIDEGDGIITANYYNYSEETRPSGSWAGYVYLTDIVTVVNGNFVDSCNIGGSTVIMVDALS